MSRLMKLLEAVRAQGQALRIYGTKNTWTVELQDGNGDLVDSVCAPTFAQAIDTIALLFSLEA